MAEPVDDKVRCHKQAVTNVTDKVGWDVMSGPPLFRSFEHLKGQWSGVSDQWSGTRKVPVSFRLDPRVLVWLRAKGEGHLTRINDILSNLMEAERRAGSGR